jgi:hypothetical protein
MDPLRHPDLIEITHRLRTQYERIVQAEQDAAVVMRERRRTLRDLLIEAEDRGERVRLKTSAGTTIEGTPNGVGLDHVTIGTSTVAIFHIEIAEFA